MASCWITVGFSGHRVEMLRVFERLAGEHRVLVLEEPSAPGSDGMFRRQRSIVKHLEEVFPGFTAYSQRQCDVLRRLHHGASQTVQIKPYMTEYEAIHDTSRPALDFKLVTSS